MEDLNTYLGVGGIAVVVGLVAVLRLAANLSDEATRRLTPLASIVVGIVWNYLVAALQTPAPVPAAIVVAGIVTGLSACGLYSATKATVFNR